MEFLNKLAQNNNRTLTTEQLIAASHIDGPALTLAVPGSGKTTLLLYRAANIIHKKNLPAQKLLTLTFSKSAANDMNTRYKKDILPHIKKAINISTIHSFCFSVVRAYYNHHNKDLNILSDGGKHSKHQILSDIYKTHNHKFITPEILEELSRIISLKKNQLDDIELPVKLIPTEMFNTLFLSYEQYKRNHNLIDFDDMLTICLDIFYNHPKTTAYYNNKFSYIQIDEAQDTSSIQNKIISMIIGDNPNLFMVADDDQSIYRFRGACADELLEFPNKYPDAKIYTLSKNFRCSPSIINTCKTLIEHNHVRYDKHMSIDDNLTDIPVKIRDFSSLYDRNSYINHSIDEPCPNDKTVSTAILYRNHISSISIIDALDRADMDFSIRGISTSLAEHKIVKDIIAFFQLALVPHDKQAFLRIAYKMNIYIPSELLQHIKYTPTNSTVFDILILAPEQSIKQKTKWIRTADTFDRIKTVKPYQAINIIENDLEYLKNLKSQCAKQKISFESQRSILMILKEIARYQSSLIDFIQRIKQLDEIAQMAKNNVSSTKLMTIHSSKGLEFDKVILVDIDKGILPSQDCMDDDPKQWEEERRLLYVAMSRAKYSLEILQMKFLNNKYIQPSPFIDEILKSKCVQQITPIASPSCDTSSCSIKLGDTIRHIHFGVGIIENIEEDIISIRFDKGIKHLSLTICLKHHLIHNL